jgi:hypothetical protein
MYLVVNLNWSLNSEKQACIRCTIMLQESICCFNFMSAISACVCVCVCVCEGNHDKPQDSPWLVRRSSRASPRYKSKALLLDETFRFRGDIFDDRLKNFQYVIIAWVGIWKLVHLLRYRWRTWVYPTTHLNVQHILRCKGAYYNLKCIIGIENKLRKITYSHFFHIYDLIRGALIFIERFKTADIVCQETSMTFIKCWAFDLTALSFTWIVRDK